MISMQAYSAVKTAQYLLTPYLKNCRIAVDATVGNGKDSLFLAENTPNDALIYSFDIQSSAISKSQELINSRGLLSKVRLVEDSHDKINIYIKQEVDIVMFNLGYLPGENHNITTQPNSTIIALEKALKLLRVGGIITVISYPGHDTGLCEYLRIKELLSSISPSIYAVNSWVAVNQANKPPVLFVIEKVRSEARESSSTREN